MMDYSACAFPKPGATKKKRPRVNTGRKNKYCIYCGKPYATTHELFPGSANRAISFDNKFQIDVCPEHHEELQRNVTAWAQEENMKQKRRAEREYLDKLIDAGLSAESALEMWMNLIGRNYIQELMPK